MAADITARLNQIYPKITSDDFLKCRGLGNEIAFYIFDYAPEEELQVRDHVAFLIKRINDQTGIKLLAINLFELIVKHLKERGLFERGLQLEQSKGSDELKKAFGAPLKPENMIELIRTELKHQPKYDLVIIYGVGSAYPLVRAHSLLNNLQPVMNDTPLVLFYPGTYDGQSVKLFGRVSSNPYYRAFRLAP